MSPDVKIFVNKKMGQLLLEQGLINRNMLNEALSLQEKNGANNKHKRNGEDLIFSQEEFEKMENSKNKINVRWGKKEVEITKVELFDKFNRKTNIFVSRDPLKIRIHYKNNEGIEDLAFGIGIFYKNGVHCFGTTTEVEKYKLNGINSEGYIDFHIKKLIMWEGDFYLNVTAING